MVVLLATENRWACPNCTFTDLTHEAQPHVRFHRCRRNGLTAPMVPAGTKAKVEAVERADWVGKELVQTDAHGRPVMAIRTTRDDGIDCAVLAPTAYATRSDR